MAFLICVKFSGYGALLKLLYCVPAPLNAALVANEKNGAKTKCLGLRSSAFWLGFRISTSSCLGL